MFDRVIQTNLRGAFLCAKYCGNAIITSTSQEDFRSIVNIASTRAFQSEPDTEGYSASKGGIIALTHSLAISLSQHKIAVNSISPGWIDVSDPRWRKTPCATVSSFREKDHEQHPSRRVGRPEDIAKAVLFLCQKDSFITGSNLVIDGGMTKKNDISRVT